MNKFIVRIVSLTIIVCMAITYNTVVENRKIKDENKKLNAQCQGLKIDKEKIIEAYKKMCENGGINIEKNQLNGDVSDLKYSDVPDGEYIGSAKGFDGEITVKVKVEMGKIISIDVISVGDDDEMFFESAKSVIDVMLKNQSVDVDVVSGATFSSRGIIDATSNALSNALSDSLGDLSGDSLDDAD